MTDYLIDLAKSTDYESFNTSSSKYFDTDDDCERFYNEINS
jgi:hypothetical protein